MIIHGAVIQVEFRVIALKPSRPAFFPCWQWVIQWARCQEDLFVRVKGQPQQLFRRRNELRSYW